MTATARSSSDRFNCDNSSEGEARHRCVEELVGHEAIAMKRRVVRLLQRDLLNPPVKAALALGVVPPTHALLETVGRKTGKPWRNPVGNGLADDKITFWIVAEHGRHAGYVRNITANPRVRVKIGRRWRSGGAEILDNDDPRARLKAIGRPVNGALVRTMGTDLLTIRITLDEGPEESR